MYCALHHFLEHFSRLYVSDVVELTFMIACYAVIYTNVRRFIAPTWRQLYSVMSTAAVASLHVTKQCAILQSSKRARDDIESSPNGCRISCDIGTEKRALARSDPGIVVIQGREKSWDYGW
jgi:hypothetical protein